jgi:hypothetical protein
MADTNELVGVLIKVNALCAKHGLDDHDRLELFEMAWLTTAAHIRSAARAVPSGSSYEQTKQIQFLSSMKAIVESDHAGQAGGRKGP